MAKYCPQKQNYALYPDCKECEEKLCEAFFCLVVGSRTFKNYPLLAQKLDTLLGNKDKVVIVSGGANGADSLAERYAQERGLHLKVFPAKWDELGKSAGYIRNEEMHAYIASNPNRGCVAFWDGKSKGTAHSIKLAKKYNNPIRVVREQEERQ